MKPKEKIARHRAHSNREFDAVDEEEIEDDDFDPKRRSVLGASAAGVLASLAGCGGGEGTPTATKTKSETQSPTATKSPTQESTEPKQTEPPQYYVTTSHTYYTGDIGQYDTNGFASACAPGREFVPGQLVGFRIGVYDSSTGKLLTDEQLDSVKVKISGPSINKTLEAHWDGDNKEHPAKQWSVRLRNTGGAKPGTYKYTILVTDGAKDVYDLGIAADQFVFLDPKTVPTATPTPSG